VYVDGDQSLYDAAANLVDQSKLAERLNSAIQRQVKIAKKVGEPIEYVRPSFDKHGLCDADRPWINGIVLTADLLPGLKSESFHLSSIVQARGYMTAFERAMR